MSVSMTAISKRNKEVDFKVCQESITDYPFVTTCSLQFYLAIQILEKAADVIVDKLKADETLPDLDEQFRASSQDIGHHKYFLLPYKNWIWGQGVEHSNFVALPPKILDEYRKIECASFMGIIPELHRFEQYKM
jgi:hypothetical protein